MKRVVWLIVASGLVVSALASRVPRTGNVGPEQVQESSLAGPRSPGTRGSIRAGSLPGVRLAPAVDEIPADVDTTGLLQLTDDVAALLEQAEVDARQGDLLTGE